MSKEVTNLFVILSIVGGIIGGVLGWMIAEGMIVI